MSYMNKFANMILLPLLRSPLHIFASHSIMLITYTGRKSGKIYTHPVQYVREVNTVTFFTPQKRIWWKNLQDKAPITLRIKNVDYPTYADEITSDRDKIQATLSKLYPRLSEQQVHDFIDHMLMIQCSIMPAHA